MKVIEKTETRLLVRHMPWLLGGLLFVFGAASLFGAWTAIGTGESPAASAFMALLGIGVLMFGWWFAPVVELDFDRAAGVLRFSEIRLYRRRTRAFPLTPGTRVAQQADYDEGARLTRLVLRAEGEVVPLERGYGSGDRNAVEAEINAWLADGAPDPGAPPRRDPPKRPPDGSTVRRRR